MNKWFRPISLLLILAFTVALLPAPASAATEVSGTLTVSAFSDYGEDITLTANFSDLTENTGTAPTGTVDFYDGTDLIGSAPLNATEPTVQKGVPYLPQSYPLPNSEVSIGCGLSCQVISWGGYTYWPLTYKDNRTSVELTAYDPDKKLLWSQTYNDGRYVEDILVDSAARTLHFTMQSSTMTLPWSDLRIVSSQASLVVTSSDYPLTPGEHSITAVYNGDASHASATTAAQAHHVNPAKPTLTLIADAQAGTYGDPVTFTVQAAGAAGWAAPTGRISLWDNGTLLASSTTSPASLTYTADPPLAAGLHKIRAEYAGDSIYSDAYSDNTLDYFVNPAPTSTTIRSSAAYSAAGDEITLTAQVRTVPSAAQTESSVVSAGRVVFKNGGRVLSEPVTLNEQGQAVLKTSALPAGTASLTAEYSGDCNREPSEASALTHQVSARVTNTPSPNLPVTQPVVAPPAPAIPAANTPTVSVNDIPAPSFVTNVATSQIGSQRQTKMTLDASLLKTTLREIAQGAALSLDTRSSSDLTVIGFDRETLDALQQKRSVLSLFTPEASYVFPADQLDSEAIAAMFRSSGSPSAQAHQIRFELNIAKGSDEQTQAARSAANTAGAVLLSRPVAFSIQALYGDRTSEISAFDRYVERYISIPAGLNAASIATAAVLEEDGSLRPVPTRIYTKNGQAYAEIKSRTNSVYVLLGGHLTFSDITDHWARTEIEDLASRHIVNGTGALSFDPALSITRAEFSAVLVRALGLSTVKSAPSFNDLPDSAWYAPAVETAASAGLVSGYPDGRFGPQEPITREQAAVMLAKTLALTGLGTEPSDTPRLQAFADSGAVSSWARESVSELLAKDLLNGRTPSVLDPSGELRRDEATVLLQRLLVASNLIDG